MGATGSDFAGGDQSVRGRHLGAGRYPCRRCQPPRWRGLFKGGAALAPLAGVDIFVFDKTGALTTGKASVTSVVTLDDNERSSCRSLQVSKPSQSITARLQSERKRLMGASNQPR